MPINKKELREYLLSDESRPSKPVTEEDLAKCRKLMESFNRKKTSSFDNMNKDFSLSVDILNTSWGIPSK